ncbi:GpE family phage tail protein [Morganella morganii]
MFCATGKRGGDFFSAECPSRRDGRTGRLIAEIPAIDIDDLIADIAMVFHWPPVSFDTMSVSELLKWHRLAAARIGQNDE